MGAYFLMPKFSRIDLPCLSRFASSLVDSVQVKMSESSPTPLPEPPTGVSLRCTYIIPSIVSGSCMDILICHSSISQWSNSRCSLCVLRQYHFPHSQGLSQYYYCRVRSPTLDIVWRQPSETNGTIRGPRNPLPVHSILLCGIGSISTTISYDYDAWKFVRRCWSGWKVYRLRCNEYLYHPYEVSVFFICPNNRFDSIFSAIQRYGAVIQLRFWTIARNTAMTTLLAWPLINPFHFP